MEFTKEQFENILNEAKPSIISAMKNQIIQQSEWKINEITRNLIIEVVTEFMNNEIIPSVKENLIANKDGIIAGAIKATTEISEVFATGLAQTFKDKMEKSWDREKIFKAMFM